MAPATPVGFVGRETELSLLTAFLRELPRGTGTAVLIEGEPGIGKSTLVRALVKRATAPQAIDPAPYVCWGTGDELSQELPLSPFLDALQVRAPGASARRNAISAMLRGEGAADRDTDVTAALSEQLLALVTDECATRPVILVVDDLQWADSASIALWGRLARLAPQVALLLIGIMRPGRQPDDLEKLRRAQNDATHLEVSPLPGPAVADLVAALAGGIPDGPLLRLASTAAGNPLYVTELIDGLSRTGELTVTESGTAQLTRGIAPTALPRSLTAAIAGRLGFVPQSVREMLRAAALLGVQFAITDLATVLGQGVLDLAPAVEEAQAVGVLTEAGTDLAFRHPLIHAAIYDEMTRAVRAALHRDTGQRLAAAGVPVDRVARQLLRAVGAAGAGDEAAGSGVNTTGARDGEGQAGFRASGIAALDALAAAPLDDWMLDWLTGAADLLVAQAPLVAAELLAQAVANTPVASGRYGWLASRLADALYRIGDRDRAVQIASRALEQADVTDPNTLVDLHWTLAQCRMMAGLSAESLAALDEALSAPGISARHRARLLVLAARTHCKDGEFETGGQVASDALAAAEESGDTWSMGWALHVLAIGATVAGRMTEALPLYDRALTVAQAVPPLADLRLLLSLNKAAALAGLDRYDDALATARQAERLAEQVGTTFRLSQVRCILSQTLYEAGRWDDSLAEIVTLPENLKEPAATCDELGIAAVIAFHRNEPDTARAHLAAAEPHAKLIGNQLIPPLTLARALDREQAGDLAAALAELTSWFDGGTEQLGQVEDLVADAVRLAVKTGDLTTAEKLATQATEFAESSQIPHRQANALYCAGLVGHGATRLLQAAERYGQASRPLPQARALEGAAEELLALEDKTKARDAFARSVEVYQSLGAAADVNRLRAAFREHGIRLGSHAKLRKAQSGRDSLTDAELTVAALVAEGLSNPDIASRLVTSPRTVGTHVSHILKKMGFAGRADIAREWARLGK
jgi:DNA-binding CsgD family transcriptional regulator